jgi:hypothetical protein
LSGYASANARIYFKFLARKPRISGNALVRSSDRRSVIFAPHPSLLLPSQYVATDTPVE